MRPLRKLIGPSNSSTNTYKPFVARIAMMRWFLPRIIAWFARRGTDLIFRKKGTLHLMKQNANTDYDATLFHHRYELAQSGFFEPLLEAILPHLSADKEKFIVDIGCGEGSHLSWFSKRVKVPLCGMDIAKEGIHQASIHFGNQALFFLGDLANLPLADESCGTLLNILTPSNYQEFMRVLAPGGTLVKVIPGNDYLTELRQQLYRSNPEKTKRIRMRIF